MAHPSDSETSARSTLLGSGHSAAKERTSHAVARNQCGTSTGLPTRRWSKTTVCQNSIAPAGQIGPASREAGSQDSIASKVHLVGVQPRLGVRLHPVYLGLKDDGHNDAVDGYGLAENDAARGGTGWHVTTRYIVRESNPGTSACTVSAAPTACSCLSIEPPEDLRFA